ncbi:hypothetical protein CCR75_003400 [Bremia lactucae]|uniref:Glucose-methanol-choline oxidoreductase N-terminal domain-containing protein n=1 Tax=Bremia lactucae TaxID=4779 RepID=A0A976NYD5_BRELC|nr:hypothetical protein CCR75_003400 [Bremia lactucae]
MPINTYNEQSSLLRPDVQGTNRKIRYLFNGMVLLLIFAGVATCVAIALRLLRRSRAPSATIVPLMYPEEFDTIIVGGGPAGSVVAKVLSDDPWRRVLLIEAGKASQTQLGGKMAIPSPLNTQKLTPFDVPYYWTNVANTPSLHWAYPDVNIAKALGGCGIHNAMLYIRALPSDLERWNMKNWTWEKALSIYMAIEDFDGPNSSFHGVGGSVRTSPPALASDGSKEFIEACTEVGIPRTMDFNGPNGRFGVGYYHFNTRNGVRDSAAKTFLGPILNSKTFKSKRDNFQLMLDTTVTKIGINNENVTQGVEVRFFDGTTQLIRLAKHGEVILTAGAINTPKILMLSGLGNHATLRNAGLQTKKHLPRVGMNLQDHPVVGMVFEYKAGRNVDLKAHLASYLKATNDKSSNTSSYGLFGSVGISAGAFLIPPGATQPEIQLTLFPQKSEPHMSNSAGLDHMAEALITIALLRPLARNRVVLLRDEDDSVDDNDSDDHLIPRVVSEVPDFEPEHLRPGDIWKITWGIRVVREIAARLGKS